MKRHELNERRKDRRAGLVAAMLYNVNRDPKKDPKGKDWTHFFPDPFEDTDAKVLAQMEKLRAYVESVN